MNILSINIHIRVKFDIFIRWRRKWGGTNFKTDSRGQDIGIITEYEEARAI